MYKIPVKKFIYFSLFVPFSLFAYQKKTKDNYLIDISQYVEEKTQIVRYMREKPNGQFLEIGSSWGDGIVNILENLPDANNLKIIVADNNLDYLKAIPNRFPKIRPYINNTNQGPKLELQQINATYMHTIANASLDGINASAIVHEIYSYVPIKHGLDQFFIEAARVLKPNGILVYRDPALQERPDEINVLSIKNKLAKYFITLFLPKFLDLEYTKIRSVNNQHIKPIESYQQNSLIFIHLKNDHGFHQYPIQKFTSIPSHLIDFNKPFSIQAPRKLLSEIQRHYTLFLRDVLPAGFIDSDKLNESFDFEKHVHLFAKDCVASYLKIFGISPKQKLSTDTIHALTKDNQTFAEFVENGIQLSFKNHEHLPDLLEYFQSTKTNIYLFKISRDKIWLDSKLATLLYRGADQGILKYFQVAKNRLHALPYASLDWLQREGEENYYYFDIDELLRYLLELSRHHFGSINKEGYILCPTNEHALFTHSRELYEHILNRDMKQIDMYGNQQDFVTTKNIIDFRLMKTEEGLAILNKIVNNNPKRFRKLSSALKQEKMLKF